MVKESRSPRLPAGPSELIDRDTAVEFRFDGRKVAAWEGDTVASALFASGVSTFSRGFKYHRPRGLLCAAGRCPNCLVNVDGVPNVRACLQQVKPGMQVRHQNAWPSLRWDFLSVLDRLGWLMPVGFYYKALHRPKLLWLLAQRVIRRVGGLGKIDVDDVPETSYQHRNQHADVAVVGGGPAGLSAALAAAEHGARVALIDDQPRLGGHLRFGSPESDGADESQGVTGNDIADELEKSALEAPRLRVMSGATVFACYQDNLLGILSGRDLVKLRAKRVVVATGSYDVPMLFENNDLPGVMLAGAAQRLVRLYGVRPGRRAVVATDGDQGYRAALDLMGAGVEVIAVVDSRPGFPERLEAARAVAAEGIPVLTSHVVAEAEGKTKLRQALVQRLEAGKPAGPPRKVRCDLLCMSGNTQPADGLLLQAGARRDHNRAPGDPEHWALPPGLQAAGDVAGSPDLATSLLQGRLAGLEAAQCLGAASPELQAEVDDARRQVTEAQGRPEGQGVPFGPGPSPTGKKQFVCFCEDVTVKDISDAVAEGFDDIQMLKRYSTASMGPCQGKMCLKALVGLCAQYTGRSVESTGTTTPRPPLQPVPLAALAGASPMPMKRTPMDRIHRGLGAVMVEAGPWQRPHSYGSPQEECLAVRQRVGIIDVSTLGKLDVRGKDAGTLLDRVYTHHFSNLPVGRTRYGLLCSDNGVILDDGTVTRVSDDHYFVTTTSGNADLIEEWFKWWAAGRNLCAHVTNVTSDYAAMNVAGPYARQTLGKLTGIDLSPAAFPYMRFARGEIAGVTGMLLRIGFVGEAGWEVHVPAEYGEHLWEAIIEAGAEFGIAPFGLEAQRVLRLEKKHVIVGQDTDAVSNPLESDLGWAVRFDKEDFIGRGGLRVISERGLRNKLVGFVMRDGLVPADGAPVVSGRTPIGRVTSARRSPTTSKGFGLAWVPADVAEEGSSISILIDGRSLPAQVTLRPFYDPDGERLRG